jgi:hypothetical protein
MSILRKALFVGALLAVHATTVLAQAPVEAAPPAPLARVDERSSEVYAFASTLHLFHDYAPYERPHPQHHWRSKRNEPFIDPARLTMLVFGWSRHVGSKHRGSRVPIHSRLNEDNPGLGASVSFGRCYGDQFECHGTIVYIDQNSLSGKAVTIGGGASKEVFRYGRFTISAGFEAFLLFYRAGYSDKRMIGPLALPAGSADFKIDRHTSIGIGIQVLPVRAGDAKRIELYNVRLRSDF